MHLRPNLVIMLCLVGVLALGVSFASPTSSSLALPAAAATETPEMFCPDPMDFDDESGFAPENEAAGAVIVPSIDNPTAPDTGKLRLTKIELSEGTCFLNSYFYPGAVVTVLSGEIRVLVQPSSLVDAPPEAKVTTGGDGPPDDMDIESSFILTPGDWLTIQNGALVGFKGASTTENAVFMVAALKPDSDGSGGGCGNGCRGRP